MGHKKPLGMLYERFERINSQISFFLLLLTQFALPLLTAYKRYIQGLGSYYYEGLGAILLLSMLSYWAARFHLSGILPVISLRMLALFLKTPFRG